MKRSFPHIGLPAGLVTGPLVGLAVIVLGSAAASANPIACVNRNGKPSFTLNLKDTVRVTHPSAADVRVVSTEPAEVKNLNDLELVTIELLDTTCTLELPYPNDPRAYLNCWKALPDEGTLACSAQVR